MRNQALRKYLRDLKNTVKFGPTYTKFKEFTMMNRKDYIDCLVLTFAFRKIKGCIVECGVWRGGMIAGMTETLGIDRNYYLFDSFEGLPPAKEIDGEAAIKWQNKKNDPGYFDNCKAELNWAEKAMKMTGAHHVHFEKGWFDKTIPSFDFKEPIAVLRLDGDWYDSTMVCLEHLFPKVQRGGLIVIDDYYAWDGCSKALHDYLSKNQRTERIYYAYTSGCYLIKD